MGADMEMSCDERVLKELGDGISEDYSMSLVRIAAGRRILVGSPLAFGEGCMKERVKRILNFKKPARLVSVAAVVLAVVLSVGFAGNRTAEISLDNNGFVEIEIIYDEWNDAVEESYSEILWSAVPAVFVNDTWFRIFENRQHIVPDLDDTWVYLGNIQSSVPGWESPSMNFQTNDESMIGAEIYHSSQARIRITNTAWNDPLNEEITGDGIIVVFNGLRLLYITEETQSRVTDVMNKAARHSLMLDGVLYSLMATAGGGGFFLTDNHVFLGEVASTVSLNEYPAENLQANREIVVGARVYRLPQNENSDIVVFFNTDTRFYYKHLPLIPDGV